MYSMDNNECINLIKNIYGNIFKIESNFELVFMSFMLYVNFKYEEIFSDPDILEFTVRNSNNIERHLRLYPTSTRRQVESMYLTLHIFLYLSLTSGVDLKTYDLVDLKTNDNIDDLD